MCFLIKKKNCHTQYYRKKNLRLKEIAYDNDYNNDKNKQKVIIKSIIRLCK